MLASLGAEPGGERLDAARDGHWAWVEPWGWTWVDDAPWGFAVSHYGRWEEYQGTLGLGAGARAQPCAKLRTGAGRVHAAAAISAVVAAGAAGAIAWFPLGPREIYRPTHPRAAATSRT